MRANILFTLSLLFPIFFGAEGFGRRRANKRSDDPNEKIDVICIPSSDPNATWLDPHYNCGTMRFGIVQKIPYLLPPSKYNLIDIKFSSGCVKCGLCLAVADKIDETLRVVHDTMPPDIWLNETEVTALLNSICDDSFKRYSLREIRGKRYICDRMPGATLVTSTADGLWEKNLRDKCHRYLAEMGPIQLYRHWQKWSSHGQGCQDLATILCRDDVGIFRDCRGIEDLPKLDHSSRTYDASAKFVAEFKCG